MNTCFRLTSLAFATAALLAVPLAARSQDVKVKSPKPLDSQSDGATVEPKTDTQKTDEPIHIPLPQTGGDDEVHAEMKRLMGEVELRLRQIDKLLAEAAAGDSKGKDVSKELDQAAAGIGALVKRSQEEGQTVVQAIDKILELANHEHPPGGT